MTSRAAARADVTVLVVAYAHQEHVGACLDSIREQTLLPARVIIADDRSPDDTAAAVTEYLAAHPDFAEYAEFVPNRENIGLNPTLNKHLERADTTYFTYISADDVMLPERIHEHTRMMDEAPEAILAYSDALVIDERGCVIHESSSEEFPWPDDEETRSRPFAELLSRNWIPAASILLRTAQLREAGGYRQDLFFEDFELLVRLSRDSPFVWTSRALVGVRRLSSSLGSTGFVGTSPRFLLALHTALLHYEGAAPHLESVAAARRWELAKRASRSSMGRRRALGLLWSSRHGASSSFAVLRHLLGWLNNSVRPRRSR